VSNRHVIDELSAYIDGEAKDPGRIRRHLQFCEACARHHLQLLKLSSHLRSLSGPAPQEGFATRVLARTAEEECPPVRRWPVFALYPAAVAILVLLLAGTGLYVWYGTTPSSPANMAAVWNDDEAVVEAFERLIEEGADLSLFENGSESEEDAIEDVSFDEVVDVLASAAWIDDEEDPPFVGEDLYGTMEALEQEDEAAVQALLREYLSAGGVVL